MDDTVAGLKSQLLEREREIATLKKKLDRFKKEQSETTVLLETVTDLPLQEPVSELNNSDILRYSRQLLLPELGVSGQIALRNTSVLVVGCGGLGCPLALYLAAAGIGRLGLLDHDVVELSNLHRQVLHTEETQGQSKALSAALAIRRLNSSIQCVPYHLQLSTENAMRLVQQYDIIADCSDNVPTRYLVNDACVLSGKPLVSASALRMEGQLTVYNYSGGPCYRCLYPSPPPVDTVTNCSDGGVLGVASLNKQLLMFDGQAARFRSIRLRPRQTSCVVCGDTPTVTRLQDYEQFCGSAATDKCRRLNILTKDQRISVQGYKDILDRSVPHLLLDVRPKVEVDICRLSASLHIPLASLQDKKEEHITLLRNKLTDLKQQMKLGAALQVFVVCKLGNDSQKAVELLEKMSGAELEELSVKDISGGLMAWAEKIDFSFPHY